MPTYEYLCLECGNRKEVVQSFSDDPLTTCDICQGKLRKVIYPVGIQFKGSGFYSTDRRASQPMSRSGKDSKADPKSESSAGKSDSAADSKGPAKVESGEGSGKSSKTDSGSTSKTVTEKSA